MNKIGSRSRGRFRFVLALASLLCAPPAFAQTHAARTPIRHLIIIVGENHSFDNLFGVYQPQPGQSVRNLLSEGIVNADGTAGPNFKRAEQWQAVDHGKYSIAPERTAPYGTLRQPNTTFAFGQPHNVANHRFPANLSNGPFQLSKYT